jgi:hypothetical protein
MNLTRTEATKAWRVGMVTRSLRTVIANLSPGYSVFANSWKLVLLYISSQYTSQGEGCYATTIINNMYAAFLLSFAPPHTLSPVIRATMTATQ